MSAIYKIRARKITPGMVIWIGEGFQRVGTVVEAYRTGQGTMQVFAGRHGDPRDGGLPPLYYPCGAVVNVSDS